MNISLETIQNLEFSKILEHIGIKCVSAVGKSRLLNSVPIGIPEEVKKALALVSEMKEIYVAEGGLPIWQFSDTRILLRKIEPLESYLESPDCQEIQNILEIVKDIYFFLKKRQDIFPHLYNRISNLDPLENLRKKIHSTIEPSGSIYDNASPDLKRIRKEIQTISNQIHIRLDRILKKQSEHLQEEYITLREGRLVIPVREYSVSKIPGIVHGQSATGQTHYVEPLSIVALNNEISELYAQEKREIIQILKGLSSDIREHTNELLINLEILTELDSIQARSQYSISAHGTAPLLSEELTWSLRNAYHPLLLRKLGDNAVPLNLEVPSELRTIIVTGPNAGGKTVVLKTIGLLQIMVQSGIHVPVDEASCFPICAQIHAVIGDEQSIENDLSTFSSHIYKLNTIIKSRDPLSLILIDEIGSGTDPAEGAALAVAVLEKLQNPDTLTIVTTHQGALKAYAQKTEGVRNAAMRFDRDTLTPQFIMELGIPGSSYAFDISRRLGLDASILERAKEILGSSQHKLDEIILELTRVKQEYDNKLEQISLKSVELDGLQSLYRQREEDLRKKRKDFERQAYDSAQQILENVNKEIEKVIRELRESNARPEIIKKSKKIISDLQHKVKKGLPEESQVMLDIPDVSIGTWIKSKRFGITGQVSKVLKDKKEVEVDAAGVKVFVPFKDIKLAVDARENEKVNTRRSPTVSASVLFEIDLRGKLAEEAIFELESYLDRAVSSDWEELRIIHGKGTGALRKKIHEYLKRNPRIKSFRLGHFGEGDAGVTVVKI